MANKFRLSVTATTGYSYNRDFDSLKSLTQFERRNKTENVVMIRYIYDSVTDKWERFAIIGNQVVAKSKLQNIIDSLT
ncbi:MAG: hypothetical protein LBR10_09895 [Prevotellaceae bacterium]|jgi:hypothetical protein|nr:hypothetical protein [Prevotellaceae bacterium]